MSQIIIPKKRRLIIPDRLRGSASEVAGYWNIRLGRMQPDGTVAYKREYEFPNIITNQGLDRMGDNSHYNTYCQLGEGTTPPAATDTALVSPIGVAGDFDNARGVVIGPPRYAYDRRVYRFGAGVATGNLTEIGASWANSTGATLYNRALILDGGGSPIAITKLADEVLDATYELRTYIPLDDVTGTINISGADYDYIIRAAEADQVKSQYSAGWGPRYFSGSIYSNSAEMTASNQGNSGYTSDINDIDSTPSGSVGVSVTPTSLAYVPGSLERIGQHSYGLGGVPIRSILYSFGWNSYQIQFDPPIPKDAENVFTVQFKHSWARRSL